MRGFYFVLAGVIAALALSGGWRGCAAESTPTLRSGEPFSGAKGWLNTAEPLSAEKLKGQVVLVDFWTYCCINCMQVLPDLKALEEKYRDQPFTVIGVHSGKFDQEKDATNIRAAVLRYGISHPVAVDSDMTIWERFGVHSWPTLVLIDAVGKPTLVLSGEGHRAELDRAIAETIARGRKDGTLAEKPLRFRLERDAAAPTSILSFPGKIVADGDGKRLFIADSGHHRVLVASLDGQVTRIIGAGKPGLADGTAGEARFNDPQGMALSPDGATLWIADRLNHALRAVDLGTGNVCTLAGDGEQGHDRDYDGPGKNARLASPWDVCWTHGALFIAMAGEHQIWRYDPKSEHLAMHAGSGREAAIDGGLQRCAFAQPSGLAADGGSLYVADSEASSIRLVDADPDGQVRTVAGSKDLFGFGLVDGPGASARFQHPLGVAVATVDGKHRVIVADTYNSTLRQIDAQQIVSTIAAPAPELKLFEPGGISAIGATVYVADTNDHRVLVVDLVSGKWAEVKVELPR